jgi:hypothetical protein
MASENRDWGYDRIVGALANLGYVISGQTVGNIPHRHALPPAPERERTTTWPAFIRTHSALLAGTDFFTAEVLTLRGLVTYYVLFFIHLGSRRVDIAGTRTSRGCGRLPGTPPWRDAAPCATVAISCTIGTPNTPSRSGYYCVRPS